VLLQLLIRMQRRPGRLRGMYDLLPLDRQGTPGTVAAKFPTASSRFYIWQGPGGDLSLRNCGPSDHGAGAAGVSIRGG